MRSKQKIILFGGSFDPIHTGHIRVALHALNRFSADELIFIPARHSPHKIEAPTPGHHRLAMIRIAIEGIERFSASDCELTRCGPSYTLDTVLFFKEQFSSDVVLHWLIGADQLTDLHRWYRVEELLKICRVSVMVRAGYPPPDFRRFEGLFPAPLIEQMRKDVVQTPRIDLSSTDIRSRLASRAIDPDMLPPGVLDYILQNNLYGGP